MRQSHEYYSDDLGFLDLLLTDYLPGVIKASLFIALGIFINPLYDALSPYLPDIKLPEVFRPQTQIVYATNPKMEKEFELMKRILEGLVVSVRDFTSEKDAHVKRNAIDNNEAIYPRSVKVIVDNARLRAEPSADGATRGTIPKETVLFAQDERNGWLLVVSPLGEDCWIRRELTEFII